MVRIKCVGMSSSPTDSEYGESSSAGARDEDFADVEEGDMRASIEEDTSDTICVEQNSSATGMQIDSEVTDSRQSRVLDESTQADVNSDSVTLIVPNLPRLQSPQQQQRRHVYLSGRRPSWSPPPPPPPRSPPPPDIPLDLPPSYRRTRPQPPNHLPVTDSWLFRGIRSHIGELALAEIVPFDGVVASARGRRANTEVACEYTWVETTGRGGAAMPTIYVPGHARVWSGLKLGHVLTEDKRPPPVRDEHFQRQPLFPYEPTFRALAEAQAQAPSRNPGRPDREAVRFRGVEVVSDADTLAQLFGFISNPVPGKTAPFRLELSTVRNTLFLSTAQHPRRGHTAKGVARVPTAVPVWAKDAVLKAGTQEGRVPFGGGHWRVVRYRLGKMVCVVRVKTEFVCKRSRVVKEEESLDMMTGVKPEMAPRDAQEGDVDIWKTAVQKLGQTLSPGEAGHLIVRSRFERKHKKLALHMAALWFGRVPYVIDTVVSRKLEVVAAQMISVRDYHGGWEKKHQASLRHMAGLLKKLKQVTRGLGGSCVVVADPSLQCLVVMKPALKHMPIPEEVALRFWGEDDDPAVTEYESTVESTMSELTVLSRTPSGFEDWEVESGTDASERKRFGAELSRRSYKRPRIDPVDRVSGWLNGETSVKEHSASSGDDDESSENLRRIGSYDTISARSSTSEAKIAKHEPGFDGAMEYEADVESEGGDEDDKDGIIDGNDDGDTQGDEDEDTSGDEDEEDEDESEDESSGSDWAAGNMSDRDLYNDASDGLS